jgi:hypothetical protein
VFAAEEWVVETQVMTVNYKKEKDYLSGDFVLKYLIDYIAGLDHQKFCSSNYTKSDRRYVEDNRTTMLLFVEEIMNALPATAAASDDVTGIEVDAAAAGGDDDDDNNNAAATAAAAAAAGVGACVGDPNTSVVSAGPGAGNGVVGTIAAGVVPCIDVVATTAGFAGDANGPSAAFRALMVAGVPIYPDPYCPEGTVYFLNTNYLSLYIHEQGSFVFTGFESTLPNWQIGYVGAVLMIAELVNTKPKSMTQVTGYNSLSL